MALACGVKVVNKALTEIEQLKNVLTELKQFGISEEKIKGIHSPIGIDISSETPEEIAISIAAEIIKIRNS